MGRLFWRGSYENVVILRPDSPNPAVHAGMRQASKFTTTIIAKQSQKDKPIAPPIVPTLSVATAMLALNLFGYCQIWVVLPNSIEGGEQTRMYMRSKFLWYFVFFLLR